MTVPVAETSEFRINKERATATLVLTDGRSVRGCFFLAGSSATHVGPERIKDVLNAERGYFPFEVSDEQGVRTTLYNRDHVVLVKLGTADEPQTDPGYDIATRRSISMLLEGGTRLLGSVRVYRPQGRDRLSDYARVSEAFRYLEADDATFIVNFRHVLEMTETEAS